MQYILRIFKPNNRDEFFVELKSDFPFLAINKGDLLDPAEWNSDKHSEVYKRSSDFPNGFILKVIGSVHRIHQLEDESVTFHMIEVFTEAVDDLDESRKIEKS